MTAPQLTLTVRHTASALDTRRGVVRLHREVLDALGLRAWDALRLTGARVSVALAAPAPAGAAPGVLLADDVTMANVGVAEGAEVVVRPCEVAAARRVTVSGSRLTRLSVPEHTLRLALIGKVLTVGDAVSLLPQDLAPPPGSDVPAVRGTLSRAVGATWTSELLTVTATDPEGPVAVGRSTVVTWRDGHGPASGRPTDQEGGAETGSPDDGAATGTTTATATGTTESAPESSVRTEPVGPAEEAVPLADLAGAESAARRLGEWFELAFDRPDLLAKLGTSRRLGVLVSGPEGVGKATVVRSVAHARQVPVVEVEAPGLAVLEPDAAVSRFTAAVDRAAAPGGTAAVDRAATPGGTAADADTPAVLLVTDVDALLPATAPPPVATVLLDRLRGALGLPGLAVVATSAHPESVDPRLRTTDLLDRELRLGLPDARTRTELLRILLRDTPVEHGVDLGRVAERTPGFVAADLVALRREAALRAALRHTGGGERAGHSDSDRDGDGNGAGAGAGNGAPGEPHVRERDLLDAVDSVRPISLSTTDTLATGGLTLDDVGDMREVKRSLTESLLWPLRYPDSFARLGVTPARGVLIYGPPGNGKTFLVRALAGTGALNVFSVKGAELMDKWVGESERAVRELFRRASEAAPSMIFLDEVDALAPRRGQSGDSGVADRVVAALLTELDGVEPLHDVVVVGATNRPELVDPALLRPGRLERPLYVPPPDAEARTEILRASARNTPLAPDVDLPVLATELEGYSAADCAALIREAALVAMRESLEATEVTAAHLAAAREVVRPSLDPEQVAALTAYAGSR